MYKAILSTTVLPKDGLYKVETLPKGVLPVIKGVPHYVGHPATREIIESLGGVKAESNLFTGLEPGEKAVCFPIQQGKSSRAEEGKTVDQEVELSDLSIRVITRIE